MVRQLLIPLFLRAQSVNALTESLNGALTATGELGRIYPNRLHALLSEEPGRTVNEKTFALIEKAAKHLVQVSPIPEDLRAGLEEHVRQRLRDHYRRSMGRPLSASTLAEELDVPPAVVSHFLAEENLLASNAPAPANSARMESGANGPPGLPDWSFQDAARRHCLDALSHPGRKVGLVIPTGGGKTRIALRIGLDMLAQEASEKRRVLWVTHRHNLRDAAREQLQMLMNEGGGGLPVMATSLLNRFEFVMVSGISAALKSLDAPPLLVIVDEGHHIAAESYRPILEHTPTLTTLVLTATPNRMDRLSLGIDEIAFTITYRELVERGVILMPEFRDFPIPDFEWKEDAIADLADRLLAKAQSEYTKILVIAPRIEQVEDFYRALVERLKDEPEHVLSVDDVGYIHSAGNSHDLDAGDFLVEFRRKPRGIFVSAQMLLEGFDDPQINTVVITYPSGSLPLLMQAAGRAVRSAPGKRKAFVVQARNDRLAYHFDQRWLYQEISDYLRPELVDIDYASLDELRAKVSAELERHHVEPEERERVLGKLQKVSPGQICRLLMCGLPYFGKAGEFFDMAAWSPVLEVPGTTQVFRQIFNDYCALGANLADEEPFLQQQAHRLGFVRDLSEGSDWTVYLNMLVSMREARRELYADGAVCSLGRHRPFQRNHATTWLRYLTFHFRPTLDPALEQFLADCYNRDEVRSSYLARRQDWWLALKLRMPLGGCEGHLLDEAQSQAFHATLEQLREALAPVALDKQFGALAAALIELPPLPLASRVLARLADFLPPELHAQYTFRLISL